MKYLNTLIAMMVFILVLGYSFNKQPYLEYHSGNKGILYGGNDDYYNIEFINDLNAVVYCNTDTIYIVVQNKEEMHNRIMLTLGKLDCK